MLSSECVPARHTNMEGVPQRLPGSCGCPISGMGGSLQPRRLSFCPPGPAPSQNLPLCPQPAAGGITLASRQGVGCQLAPHCSTSSLNHQLTFAPCATLPCTFQTFQRTRARSQAAWQAARRQVCARTSMWGMPSHRLAIATMGAGTDASAPTALAWQPSVMSVKYP